MPPYQGGGEMILNVDYFKTTYKQAPHRFEAGTPDMSGVIALHPALDYLDAIGRDAIFKHDQELATYAYDRLAELKGIRLFGPKTGRAGLVSFLLNDVHAHDVVTVADQRGVALRGGHHCNQPLMKRLGVPSTARASFYFYNNQAEVDRFIEVVKEIQKFLEAKRLRLRDWQFDTRPFAVHFVDQFVQTPRQKCFFGIHFGCMHAENLTHNPAFSSVLMESRYGQASIFSAR